jgi:two-component system response regulator DesR
MEISMKVLIADSSPVVAERLAALMLEIPSVKLLAPAATGAAMLEAVRAHDPEVLVVDAGIVCGKERGLVETVRKEKPAIALIILSNVVDPQYRKHFEAAGADLFMDKSYEFIQLLQFVSELVRAPQSAQSGTLQQWAQKRRAHTTLKVGIQLGLIVFSMSSFAIGP